MGYRSKFFLKRRVDLGEGYWAEIVPLTKGEDDTAKQELTGNLVVNLADEKNMNATLNSRAYADSHLLQGIKAWNLDDEDGNTLPITIENIQAMLDAHATKLLAELRKMTNPVATPQKVQD
jgi:hypothetical protein